MSRHTLNDGITPDDRIKGYNLHMPILGPSPKLIGDYYKRGLGWEKFEQAYLEEIRTEPKASFVRAIAEIATAFDMTLFCIEDVATHCHRRLLAEECLRYQPKLVVIHR